MDSILFFHSVAVDAHQWKLTVMPLRRGHFRYTLPDETTRVQSTNTFAPGSTTPENERRTRAGLEVDFVVYTPSEFIAIEVKNAAKVAEALSVVTPLSGGCARRGRKFTGS